MNTWRSGQWKWKLANRARVQHMYEPWIDFGNERTFRRRCDPFAVTALFKSDEDQIKAGKCKRCQQYTKES